MNARSERLYKRVDAVEARLARLAEREPPAGRLTEPDQPSGERWDWGQVWAHLGEFVQYWVAEVRTILAADEAGPVMFGRTKSDAARVAAIERDRGVPAPELMSRLGRHLEDLRDVLRELPERVWSAPGGRHPTLGTMPMELIMEEFLVGHLEAHAAQLEGLLQPVEGS